jgi:hypothetical protein
MSNWESEFEDTDEPWVTSDTLDTKQKGERFNALINQFGVIFGDKASDFEPPNWLIKPFLVENTVSAMYGQPGTFKSFVALHMALCISTGVAFNGQTPTRKGLTVYIAAEGEKGVGLRVAAWLEHYRQTLQPDDFWLLPMAVNLLDPKSVNALIEMLTLAQESRGVRAELFVVDTLAQCTVGADEQSSQAMGQATAAMIRIRRELDTSVVFIHHSGKDEKRGMRGSSSIKGNTDAMWCIEREGKELAATIITQRQKDVLLTDDVTFSLVNVKVSRLVAAGHEINESLVVDFGAPRPVDANKQRIDMLQLRAIVNAIEIGGGKPISVGAAVKASGQHDTSVYKDRLVALLPENEFVSVEMNDDPNERLVRAIMRIPSDKANNKYGQVMLLPVAKRDVVLTT